MVTSEAQEIKKQETLVRFSIISYKTRLSVPLNDLAYCKPNASSTVYKKNTKLWVWVGLGDGGGTSGHSNSFEVGCKGISVLKVYAYL